MRNFIQKLFRWLNIFLILATLAAYLSPYVNPQTTWIFAIFGLAYPFLLASNVVFVLFWLYFKKKNFLFSLVCILLGWSHVQQIMGFSAAPKSTEETIEIMSYNSYNFRPLHGDKQHTELKKALNTLQESAPGLDIVCFQELTSPSLIKTVGKTLKMPHSKKHHQTGVLIFSKYPIKKSGEIGFGKKTGNSCIWVDIKTPQKIVRVYSLHLQSTKISTDANRLMEAEELQTREALRGIRGILSKYRHSANKRVEQVEKVLAHVQKSKHPVILCGDFNDTPLSYVYTQFTNLLDDNFYEAGRGWGATYAGSLPGLKIDYIFSENQYFKVLKHQVIREEYSDHYPVYSSIEWR